jgi:hypothetical protein
MNSFYQMMLVVISVFSFDALQAGESFSSMEFSINGKPTDTLIVGTPKNWVKAESVKEPFHYKFIHESGDCEAYLVFSCYTSRPSKGDIFSTVNFMKALYGENYLNIGSALNYESKDNSTFLHFVMPKGDRLEHVVLFSYLGDDNLSCIATFVLVYKEWDAEKSKLYGGNFIESIRFINH